jgi:organic radical activating enzyme
MNHTAVEIADRLEENLRSDINPDGKFMHPKSGSETHMCFTGGEPMMKNSQRGIEAVMRELHSRGNMPNFVTIETNGTQKLSDDFIEFLKWFGKDGEVCEWFWSFSPKLFNTSGEKARKAIKPDVVASYQDYSANGHLKFVVNGTQETWDELEEVLAEFRREGIEFPVWIMPVGATKEAQETKQVKTIVAETLRRGYNVSGRLHAHMLGNELGT